MFLDFGTIISDATFCAQSQIMVEKFPNFRQNLSAFVRGWQLVAVQGVTWPFWIMWHQLEDDSSAVQAGVPVQSRPLLVDSDELWSDLLLSPQNWQLVWNTWAFRILKAMCLSSVVVTKVSFSTACELCYLSVILIKPRSI